MRHKIVENLRGLVRKLPLKSRVSFMNGYVAYRNNPVQTQWILHELDKEL